MTPATCNIKICILQLRNIVARSFILHMAGFMDPSLIKDSVDNESFKEGTPLT